MNLYIPPELINEIARHILDYAPSRHDHPEAVGQNLKPQWNLIHDFTLTCRGFRLIGLALWFRELYLASPEDLKTIDSQFPVLKNSWCRHLHCVQEKDSEASSWDLAGFTRLSSLRIDWLCIGVPDVDELDIPNVVNVESKIRDLDIRGVRYPSPMLLMSLVSPFTDLVTLKLDFLRIWCGLCHTCILVRLPSPPPATILYADGLGLPYHYTRFLFPLNALEEVSIRLPDFGPGLPSPGLSAQANDNLWTGECDRCMSLMYEDDTFRTVWVSRKKGGRPENLDKWSPYLIPPRLKKVEWAFWKMGPAAEGMPFSLDEIDSEEEAVSEEVDEDEDNEQ